MERERGGRRERGGQTDTHTERGEGERKTDSRQTDRQTALLC